MNKKLKTEFELTISKGKSMARRKLYFMLIVFMLISIIICFTQYDFVNIIIYILALEITTLLPILTFAALKNEKEFVIVPEHIILEFIENFKYVDSSKRVGMCKYGLVIMNAFTFKIVLFDKTKADHCVVNRTPIVNAVYVEYNFIKKKKLKVLNYSWFERTNLDKIIDEQLLKHVREHDEKYPYLDLDKNKKRIYEYNNEILNLNQKV